MKKFAPLMVFMMSVSATANVCDRSPDIVADLVDQIRKPCAQITASDLEHVTSVHLGGKGLKQVIASDLDGLDNLDSLDLSDNQITTIPEGLFYGRHMSVLYLEDNQIESLPNKFFDHFYVRHLNLARNRLKTLPADFLHYQYGGTDSLELSNNFLKTLPGNFFKDAHVSFIHLSHNLFETLPDELFEGAYPQEVDLSENYLRALPKSLLNAPMDNLDVACNFMTKLDVTQFESILKKVEAGGYYGFFLSAYGNGLSQPVKDAFQARMGLRSKLGVATESPFGDSPCYRQAPLATLR